MNRGGRAVARRRSLRLISLSNYVFVLEISQISGIVPNVSLLIRVVMRVCSGREESAGVKGGWDGEMVGRWRGASLLEPEALGGPNLFINNSVVGITL